MFAMILLNFDEMLCSNFVSFSESETHYEDVHVAECSAKFEYCQMIRKG